MHMEAVSDGYSSQLLALLGEHKMVKNTIKKSLTHTNSDGDAVGPSLN